MLIIPTQQTFKERDNYFQKLQSLGISAVREIENIVLPSISKLLQPKQYSDHLRKIKQDLEIMYNDLNISKNTTIDTMNQIDLKMKDNFLQTQYDKIHAETEEKVEICDLLSISDNISDIVDISDNITKKNMTALLSARFEPLSQDMVTSLRQVLKDRGSQQVLFQIYIREY